jgi:hypothetical protein
VSAIATTTAVPLSALPALRRAARPRSTLLGWTKDLFPEALARHGRAMEVLDPSGEPLDALLAWLEQRRGIDLSRSAHDETAREISTARGSRFLILSEEHLPHLAKLDESLSAPGELATFFTELHGRDVGEREGERMREALGFLRRAVEAVGPGTVVLLAML